MKNFEFVNDTCIVFEGFYESNLFNSDTEYYLNEILQDEEHPETYEITGDNYKNYEHEVCELHVDSLLECISDMKLYNNIEIVTNITLKGMWNPKYYNFETDKLRLNVTFNLNTLKKYCFKDNEEDFNSYLKYKYTSYDGYCSFIKNNLYGFKNQYKNEFYKNRCIIVMLEYFFIRCIFDNKTIKEIYENSLSDSETDYKQRIYEQLTELQIRNSSIIKEVTTA